MPQDQLRSAIDAIRLRLQAELDGQLAALEERQADAIAAARREAETQIEQTWSARLEQTREEWAARLESELSSAASAAEQRALAEAARLRSEADHAIAQARAEAREELDRTLEAERVRAAQELERERQQLHEAHEAALAEVRAQLDAERQRGVSAAEAARAEAAEQMERVRSESAAALEAARAEVPRAVDAERQRVQSEMESARAEGAAALDVERERLRAELEAVRAESAAALETERQRVKAAREEEAFALDAERRRAESLTAALAEARAAAESAEGASRAAIEAARSGASDAQARLAAAERDARSAEQLREEERQWRVEVVERLLSSVKTIAAARSLSDTLAALVNAAAAEAPRAAVFIVNGRQLQGWRTKGFGSVPLPSIHTSIDEGGALADAIRTSDAVSTAFAAAPKFASLPADRVGLAVPITVGGQPVAVLYADDGSAADPEAPASWPEGVQLLARHASVCLAHLTAVRTTQAMRAAPGAAHAHAGAAATPDDDGSARRYARLLVSEIKLYNEGAVRVGREKRDLLNRLGPEIERARRLYQERVPHAAGARGEYFQQELVQTLADGDPALLGGSA